MWFLYVLSWFAFIFQICFVTLAIAAGLYYLAELVEEFTTTTAKVIKYVIWGNCSHRKPWFTLIPVSLQYYLIVNLVLDVCLLLFESLPIALTIGLFVANLIFLLMLQTFPYVEFTSPLLLISLVILVSNHYFAFNHFAEEYYDFSEVLGFFTICMWVVPFSFFISLSANEYVLPVISTSTEGDQDNGDIVSNYFKKKSTKFGLLSFLKSAQQSILPERIKKSF